MNNRNIYSKRQANHRGIAYDQVLDQVFYQKKESNSGISSSDNSSKRNIPCLLTPKKNSHGNRPKNHFFALCLFLVSFTFLSACDTSLEEDPSPSEDSVQTANTQDANDSPQSSDDTTDNQTNIENPPPKPIEYILLATNVNTDLEGSAENLGDLPNYQLSTAKIARSVESRQAIRDKRIPRLLNSSPISETMRANDSQAKVSAKRKITKRLDENTSSHIFNAYDKDDNAINISASLQYGSNSSRSLIYVEEGEQDLHDWQAVGRKFDDEIYPTLTSAFGEATDVDDNGKIVLLYYNILGDDMTTGYFWAGDLFSETSEPGSNEMEIFYINLNWGPPDDEDMMRTLAHEFQHMINFGNRTIINDLIEMDTWLDEGLAESSEQLIFGYGTSRIAMMSNDNNHLIRDGLSLIVWGDGDEESYALVYTFMQYCRIQAQNLDTPDFNLYQALIKSETGDAQAISEIIKERNPIMTDFATLITNYRLANLLLEPSGPHGYGGEKAFDDIRVHAPSADNIALLPGGAIYLYLDKENHDRFVSNGQGYNIRFAKAEH